MPDGTNERIQEWLMRFLVHIFFAATRVFLSRGIRVVFLIATDG
jgi:hypothetical protein